MKLFLPRFPFLSLISGQRLSFSHTFARFSLGLPPEEGSRLHCDLFEKKNLLLSIEFWLVYRDPYVGLLKSPYNSVGFLPLYNPNNQVFFHCSFEDGIFK